MQVKQRRTTIWHGDNGKPIRIKTTTTQERYVGSMDEALEVLKENGLSDVTFVQRAAEGVDSVSKQK